jgi:hypothetical protein
VGNLTGICEYGIEITGSIESNEVEVPINHNPAIEVTKLGPDSGIFNPGNVTYNYTVTNTGDDCLTDVNLFDDMIGEITNPTKPDSDDYLSPGEEWTYEVVYELVCDGNTTKTFSNRVIGNATNAQGTTVEDDACWNVLVFQWLPRSKGYWGNWDNHMNEGNITALLGNVSQQSSYFENLEIADVEALLNPPPKLTPQKGKKDPSSKKNKAEDILAKQLLTTWLGVKSYEAYVAGNDTGNLTRAIDPDALVYLNDISPCVGAADLFGFDDEGNMTVMELLRAIEAGILDDWNKHDFNIAYCVLNMINNSESNDYMMFMHPAWDETACSP